MYAARLLAAAAAFALAAHASSNNAVSIATADDCTTWYESTQHGPGFRNVMVRIGLICHKKRRPTARAAEPASLDDFGFARFFGVATLKRYLASLLQNYHAMMVYFAFYYALLEMAADSFANCRQ